jgi:hypothetical protein
MHRLSITEEDIEGLNLAVGTKGNIYTPFVSQDSENITCTMVSKDRCELDAEADRVFIAGDGEVTSAAVESDGTVLIGDHVDSRIYFTDKGNPVAVEAGRCPDGSPMNFDDGKPLCSDPANGTYDEETGGFDCDEGAIAFENEDGTIDCICHEEAGYYAEGSACLKCPDGTSSTGGGCECTDSDRVWSDISSRCVCDPEQGFHEEDGVCATCPDESMRWDERDGRCECPRNLVFDGESCGCPEGMVLDSLGRSCMCEEGTVWKDGECLARSDIPTYDSGEEYVEVSDDDTGYDPYDNDDEDLCSDGSSPVFGACPGDGELDADLDYDASAQDGFVSGCSLGGLQKATNLPTPALLLLALFSIILMRPKRA